MLHDGEDPEQMLDEASIRRWIHAREPADATLVIARKVVYGFHARVAERWKSGRVFLAGDAAHLTPPFAGQGMNSGVRDAANLAWKLAAVERGQLSPTLLDTYEMERKPHSWSLIKMAVRIGTFMQPKSILMAMLTQGGLKLCSVYRPVRDYVLQLKFKPKPRFAQGFFISQVTPSALVAVGQLLPQPMVEMLDGAHLPMDEVLGHGFSLLALADADVSGVLSDFAAVGLACLHVQVVSQSDDFIKRVSQSLTLDVPDAVIRDHEGVLEKIIRSAQAQAVVLRPDRYVLAYLQRQNPSSNAGLTQLLKRKPPAPSSSFS
jgi:3-(3-hydroxy-phenyl)propionate hydroxylase